MSGESATATDVAAVGALMRGRTFAVLTGAGISTESGIPDYRGPDGVMRVTPMTYRDFRSGPEARRRYWARAYAGWVRFSGAGPNAGHVAVAALQRAGVVGTVITQNVDRLHQRAGTGDVIDLHGTLDRVRCLGCGREAARDDVHTSIREANPAYAEAVSGRALRPDGDVDVADDEFAAFVAPLCGACGGDSLKPDVVFFGESVPKERVAQAFAAVDAADGLLVLGSSLTVFSGYRFVKHAAAAAKPVVIITQGPTRGDGEATLRLDARLGDALPALADALGA